MLNRLASHRPDRFIAAVYLVAASLWILLSDRLLVAPDLGMSADAFSTIKGLGFVGFTAILLFLLLRREFALRNVRETALAASEQRFRQAITEAPLPTMVFVEDGQVLAVSQSWADITGYTPAQLATLESWTELAYGERKAAVRAVIDRLFQINHRVDEGEFEITCADGSKRAWEFSSTPLGQLPDGRRVVISIAADVTERNRDRVALEDQRDVLQAIFDHVPVMITFSDPRTGRRFINRFYEDRLGWTLQDMAARPDYLSELYPDSNYRQRVLDFIRAGEARWGDFKTRTRSGEVLDTLWLNMRLPDGQFLGLGLDVTERNRLQDQLHSAAQFLQRIVESSPLGIIAVDAAGVVTLWNPAAERIYGWTKAEVLGKHLPYRRGAEMELFHEALARVAAGETITGAESQLLRPDGVMVELSVSTSPLYDRSGAYVGSVGIVQDITERKLVEERLRESEETFRLLFHNNPLPMWVYDQETLRFLEVNEAAISHYGYSYEQFMTMTIRDIRPPEDRERLEQHLRQDRMPFSASGEWRHTLHDGRVIDVEITSHTIQYAGREGVLVIAQDITERKRAQEAVRESEEQLRQLAEAIQDVVFLLDAQRPEVLYLSPSFERLFGQSRDAMTSDPRAFLELVHPDDRERMRAELDAQQQGRSVDSLCRVVRPDGALRWIRMQSYPVRDAAGGLSRIAGIFEDITELHDKEEQLKFLAQQLVQVQELERREIARELHDEIGQMLTGMSVSLNLMASQYHGQPEDIADVQSSLTSLMKRVRAMSLDLRPAMLDDFGLQPALHWLIRQYSQRTAIQVDYQPVGIDRRFHRDVETAVYRIVQESLTNVARYADTDRAEVRVTAAGGQIVVTVRDWGKGFDVAAKIGTRMTVGLLGMRERTYGLDGNFAIESALGQGTTVRAEIPVKLRESQGEPK